MSRIKRWIWSIVTVSLCASAPAMAKDRPLTPEETAIATAFDAAVRGDAALAGLSALPWGDGGEIWLPQLLGPLKYCKASHAMLVRNTLYLEWSEAVDAAHPCGGFGYYAMINLKKGRIKRVTMGEIQIVVT